jgi:signal peptidase II
MYKKIIYNFFLIFGIFLIDRLTKLWVIDYFTTSEKTNIILSKFLNLNLIWNSGVAFGLFSLDNKLFYNYLTTLILIIIIVVLIMAVRSKGLERYSFMLILGGSLGNIFDRLFYSAVPDFIDFHFENFHWFIFNVADIFITLGVILLISNEFFIKNKN